MKRLLVLLIAMVALVATSFAQTTTNKLPVDAGVVSGQVSAQSSTITLTEKGFNWLWLNDGYDNLAAVSYTIAPIGGTNGRLRLQALGASDPSDASRKTYLSLGLGYNVFNAANGFRLDVFAGPKGFNIADKWEFQRGKGALVFGFGISVPLGS